MLVFGDDKTPSPHYRHPLPFSPESLHRSVCTPEDPFHPSCQHCSPPVTQSMAAVLRSSLQVPPPWRTLTPTFLDTIKLKMLKTTFPFSASASTPYFPLLPSFEPDEARSTPSQYSLISSLGILFCALSFLTSPPFPLLQLVLLVFSVSPPLPSLLYGMGNSPSLLLVVPPP